MTDTDTHRLLMLLPRLLRVLEERGARLDGGTHRALGPLLGEVDGVLPPGDGLARSERVRRAVWGFVVERAG